MYTRTQGCCGESFQARPEEGKRQENPWLFAGMWLLESLTCKELAQDSEDWLRSNVSVDIWIYACLAGPHKEINQWRRKVS